jgi:hypothetical protein
VRLVSRSSDAVSSRDRKVRPRRAEGSQMSKSEDANDALTDALDCIKALEGWVTLLRRETRLAQAQARMAAQKVRAAKVLLKRRKPHTQT